MSDAKYKVNFNKTDYREMEVERYKTNKMTVKCRSVGKTENLLAKMKIKTRHTKSETKYDDLGHELEEKFAIPRRFFSW